MLQKLHQNATILSSGRGRRENGHPLSIDLRDRVQTSPTCSWSPWLPSRASNLHNRTAYLVSVVDSLLSLRCHRMAHLISFTVLAFWVYHFCHHYRVYHPKCSIFSAERDYVKQFQASHWVKTINHPSPFRNRKGLMEIKICSILDRKNAVKT
jgi:hypothetical protein